MTKVNMDKVKNGLENAPVVTSGGSPIEALISKEGTRKRFQDVLGKKAAGFLSSVLSAYNTNSALQECEPATVLSSAMVAATLDLPINANLGFAYIVPYKGKATFQMGWKGFVQLAMRSGLYKTINVTEVRKGQLKSYNPFTGEMEFVVTTDDDNEVVGYVAYERLLNGFEKYVYMTKADTERHAKKFSQSYKKGYGVWVDDFDSMAKKTVIKALLSKWGVLSIEMQKAIEFDQAAVVDDKPVYLDNGDKIVEATAEPIEGESASGLAGEEGPNRDR